MARVVSVKQIRKVLKFQQSEVLGGKLPSHYHDDRQEPSAEAIRTPKFYAMTFFLPFMTLGVLLTFVFAIFTTSVRLGVVASESTADQLTSHCAVTKPEASWAQYSPYFPAGEYQLPPQGCKVTQVNILQRHGARFPTSGAAAGIESVISKLKAARAFADPRLHFLANFTYDLGTDDLVSFGAAQSFEAGEQQFQRYSLLVNDTNLPFVRASSSERVVLSATNWTAGFASASHQKFIPKLSVILAESSNDTLKNSMCPKAGSAGAQTALWQSIYATPIAARLQEAAPGSNITEDDIFSLLSLCPFETVYKESTSPFCHMFSEHEFKGFEYSADLEKFYGTGDGQALGRVQGVGYVNELLARLTGRPVQDRTQTNTTLDSSPSTFPLNRTIYADFSHDNQMIAIYAAIGLFPQPSPLDPVNPNPGRTYVASRLVPFSSRMVAEKLTCAQIDYVRIFVNDERQPLEFCGADRHDMCPLDAFVASQGYARSGGGGDFELCFD